MCLMVGGNYSQDRLFGDLVALLGVVFFGFYAVAIRYGKATDMTPAIQFGY
jgi:drug/metabolite transporter (DMT)-like permease